MSELLSKSEELMSKELMTEEYHDEEEDKEVEIDGCEACNIFSELEEQPYMTYRLSWKKIGKTLFDTKTLLSLPKDITVTHDAKSIYFGKENYVVSEETVDDVDDDGKLSIDTGMNIRCATKLPHEPIENYKNHVCNCNNNVSCKIAPEMFPYEDYPTAFYSGGNHVICKCEDNIITRFVKDYRCLYEFDDIDILINSIDDFGMHDFFRIVIVDGHISIYYEDGWTQF